jgi:hypothetical protein
MVKFSEDRKKIERTEEDSVEQNKNIIAKKDLVSHLK